MKKIKRIQAPLIEVSLFYQPFGSSAIIVDHYELNEYEFRQLQLDYAKGFELQGYTLRDMTWTVYIKTDEGKSIGITGGFNSDGSLTKSMPDGFIDIGDKIALELFLLKKSKRDL